MSCECPTSELPCEAAAGEEFAQGAAKGSRGGFFLRAESFYNVSTKAIEYERELGRPMYGDRTLHEQSNGESFLSFIRIFTRTGLFIMDEPEAALSPQRQLSLFSRTRRGPAWVARQRRDQDEPGPPESALHDPLE